MRRFSVPFVVGLTAFALADCVTTPHAPGPPADPPLALADAVLLVAHAEPDANAARPPAQKDPRANASPPPAMLGNGAAPLQLQQLQGTGLADMIGLTLQRNPRLAEVGWAVESARGRALQAGLYPNPTVSFTADEVADRTGPVGILGVSAMQEIVTANKLGLSVAAADKEVDQATLNLVAERYRVYTEVRQAYYEALAIQRRAEILEGLVEVAARPVATAEKLLASKEAARERAARFRDKVLPRAEETLQLARRAYQGGQFEYLRIVEAQRSLGDARLELVRSLGEAWRAGGEIAGLMLEDHWPTAPAPERRHL